MKKYFLLFLIFIIPTISYAKNEVDFSVLNKKESIVFSKKGKTIKELKSDLEKIQEKKETIDMKIENFIKDSNLKTYIKSNLQKTDILKLEQLINQYNQEKTNIELSILHKQIPDTQKKELTVKLLKIKIQLYKDMVTFIKPEKYSSYIKYVQSDTQILSEKNKIEEKKQETKKVIEKKVEILENKIKKYKTDFSKDIKKLIEQKIEQKIKALQQNKAFMKLKKVSKVELIEKTIKKSEQKLDMLDTKINNDVNGLFKESNKQKKEVYKISIQKLKEFKNNIKR